MASEAGSMPDVDLRVFYDKAETVAEMADGLVDSDPLELRDLALNLLHDVEALKAALAEARSVMDQMRRLDDPQTAVAALIHLDEALAQRDAARAELAACVALIPEGTDEAAPIPDLREIEKRWLRGCPIHDAGIPGDCYCPEGDYRAVIQTLIDEVWRTRKVAADSYHTLSVRFVDEPWKTRQEIAKVSAERDSWRDVVEAAKAWRAMRSGTPTTPKPEAAALITAVDALSTKDGA